MGRNAGGRSGTLAPAASLVLLRGRGRMSVELIGIGAVGVALSGVILTATRGLRQDMARLEGLLEGLREAITGRVKAG